MESCFDELIDRKNTSSMKWEKYEGTDIIPMWVADMDFKTPPAVLEALQNAIDHGIFGYTNVPEELNNIMIDRLMKLYGWKVKKEWIIWIPGVVTGINRVCSIFGKKDKNIVTTVPIYPPFLEVPQNSRQNFVTVPMKIQNHRMTFDFEKLEQALSKNASVFILCNPYNPGGSVFTKEELARLVELCSKYKVLICSDEIHSDFVLDSDKKHIPTAILSREAAANSITLMAPSKTYNIPGLGCSFAVVSNSSLREQFEFSLKGHVPSVNMLGFYAAQAAFSQCDQWLSQMIAYLKENRDLVIERVNKMKGCSVNPIEATFLAWIDVRETGLNDPVKFFEDAGVGLSDGKFFGQKGFVRLNFGCPRSLLEKGLDRMKKALNAQPKSTIKSHNMPQ